MTMGNQVEIAYQIICPVFIVGNQFQSVEKMTTSPSAKFASFVFQDFGSWE
jgi:hypothetical protein